ncbi:MAG TPA: MFS transporter [Candidatus Dormibacteraeota bacterium]|jgi:MFS family permease|nr:MFS transporter [Candidatus Dormibacteraeota bacterium]
MDQDTTPELKRRLDRLAEVLDRLPMNRAQWTIIFLVALGALFDAVEQYNSGYAAPSLIAIWHISGTEVGLLTTVTFGAMAVGSLIAGVLGDLIGRKVTYMYNLALYTVGALVGAFAPNIEVLLLGRFIVGLGLGGELNTGLTILSELIATRRRGTGTAILNVAAGGAGIFLSAALGFVILGPLGGLLGGVETSWRWLLGVLVIPAVLIFYYRRYIPESPRYLISHGRIQEANQVLSMLAAGVLTPSKVTVQEYVPPISGPAGTGEHVNLADIFARPFAKRTIAIWIISLMTFGAQVAITVFMPTVLASEGYTVVRSLFYSMIINVGGLVGSILSAVFAYYVNRRIVLGWGSLLAVLIALAFGFSRSLGLIVLFGALLQLMFILLNTTTWVYTPEQYPTRIRAFGTGAAVVVALIGASVVPLVAGAIFDTAGATGILVMVAVMYAIMAMTVLVATIETRGQSLEALSEHVDLPSATGGTRSEVTG